MNLLRALAAAVLVALAALAGCGGEDDNGSGRTLTKAEYEQRYRAIGDDNLDQVEELQKAFDEAAPGDTDAIGDALREFAGLMRADARAMDALQPPADIAKEHQDYADLLMRTADVYEDAAEEVDLAAIFEWIAKEENLEVAGAFTEAIEKGDYELSEDAGTLPGLNP